MGDPAKIAANAKVAANTKAAEGSSFDFVPKVQDFMGNTMVRIIVLPIKSFTFGTKSNDEPSVAAAADPAAGGTFSAFDISIHST